MLGARPAFESANLMAIIHWLFDETAKKQSRWGAGRGLVRALVRKSNFVIVLFLVEGKVPKPQTKGSTVVQGQVGRSTNKLVRRGRRDVRTWADWAQDLRLTRDLSVEVRLGAISAVPWIPNLGCMRGAG